MVVIRLTFALRRITVFRFLFAREREKLLSTLSLQSMPASDRKAVTFCYIFRILARGEPSWRETKGLLRLIRICKPNKPLIFRYSLFTRFVFFRARARE